MSILFRKDNPRRPPHWIYERARAIRAGEDRATTASIDGEENSRHIKDVIAYLDLADSIQAPRQQHWLVDRFPALYWAHDTFDNPQATPRYEIEARIMARQDNKEIGAAVGYAKETIAVYAKVFFDVRDKLDHPGYIYSTVLGDEIHRHIDDRRYWIVWKLFGYALGPGVLEALIRKFPVTGWAKNIDAAADVLQDVAIGNTKVKGALAATFIDVSPQNQLAIMDIFTKFIEVERTTAAAGAGGEKSIVNNFNVMLKGLPFAIGGLGKQAGVLQNYDEQGIDLHTDEQMLLAAGLMPPALKQLEDMRVPS